MAHRTQETRFLLIGAWRKDGLGDFPAGPARLGLELPTPGNLVWSLVRELSSHVPHGQEKKGCNKGNRLQVNLLTEGCTGRGGGREAEPHTCSGYSTLPASPCSVSPDLVPWGSQRSFPRWHDQSWTQLPGVWRARLNTTLLVTAWSLVTTLHPGAHPGSPHWTKTFLSPRKDWCLSIKYINKIGKSKWVCCFCNFCLSFIHLKIFTENL